MGLPLSKILCEQWAVLDQVCGGGRWTGGPVKILCDVDADRCHQSASTSISNQRSRLVLTNI
jgi:hypothetical protein